MARLIETLRRTGEVTLPGGRKIVETKEWVGNSQQYTGRYRVFVSPSEVTDDIYLQTYIDLPGRGGLVTIRAAIAATF